MGRAIGRNGGRINAYMGDGLMALFEEAPEARPNASARACAAALEMQTGLEKLNPNIESLYGRALKMGIGIHYGEVVVGAVGEARDKRITAIGDAVNLASRIEAKTKETGAAILISDAVRAEAGNRIRVDRSFSYEIPGKTGLYALHEVAGIVTAVDER
jgi:adenylate cyclase